MEKPAFAVLFVRIADVQGHVPAGLEDAVDFRDHLFHGAVVFAAGGVEFADVAGIGAVIEMRGVRGIDEDEVGLFGELRRELAGIDAEDVFAGGVHVVAQGAAAQFARDIEGGAAAGAGIDHEIFRFGVSLEQVPDDVAGRGAAIVGVALDSVAVMLRGIFPERGGLEAQGRLMDFHAAFLSAQRWMAKSRVHIMELKGGRMKWFTCRWALGLSVMAASVFCMVDRCLAAEDVASRIKYDQQCFTINGKDTFVFSGAFHYFRCPKDLWAERFTKMKAAGLNTVETYVAWNWNEPLPPANPDDFSKVNLSDLNDWLEMAIDQFGFNVIIRPGPYICAEWDGGGYPQWLITKKPKDFKGSLVPGGGPGISGLVQALVHGSGEGGGALAGHTSTGGEAGDYPLAD